MNYARSVVRSQCEAIITAEKTHLQNAFSLWARHFRNTVVDSHTHTHKHAEKSPSKIAQISPSVECVYMRIVRRGVAWRRDATRLDSRASIRLVSKRRVKRRCVKIAAPPFLLLQIWLNFTLPRSASFGRPNAFRR